MKLSVLSLAALASTASAQQWGFPPPMGGYGGAWYPQPAYGYPGGYPNPPRPFGPAPYQEPYLPAEDEFACGMYTWTYVPFEYRKPVPAIPDGSQSWLLRENFKQDHLLFITTDFECLCDAFSNPILNVCRQKTEQQEAEYTEYGYGTTVPGAGMYGPLPSKRSPFPPPRPDGSGAYNCGITIEMYIPFTSPLPWEKHYSIVYEYEQDSHLECMCDTGGAPLMDTCRQIVEEIVVPAPMPAPLPADGGEAEEGATGRRFMGR